jgi:hypothetical protein
LVKTTFSAASWEEIGHVHPANSLLGRLGEMGMWTIKVGLVFARGDDFEQTYIENELGTKIILINLVGHIEAGLENFEYREASLSFTFLATRVDKKTHAVTDVYTVSLGSALVRVEFNQPVMLDRARDIARNIKEALLVWRYPGQLADILSCHSPASNVVFRMKDWDQWTSSLEGNWP